MKGCYGRPITIVAFLLMGFYTQAQTFPAPFISEQVESYTTATEFALPYYPQGTGAIEFRADVSLNSSFTSFVPGYNNKLITDPYFVHVSGLTGGTLYYVRMRAIYSGGTSPNSNVFLAVTKPAIMPATNVTATSFVANCNPTNPLDYYFDVSTSSDFSSFVSGYQFAWSSGPNALVTGLSPNTTYYYRFRVDYGPVMSYNSDYGTVTTLPPPPAPPVVEETGVYKGTNFIYVVWNPSSNATSYQIDIAYDPQFTSYVPGYNNLSVTGVDMGPYKRHEATGLKSGTTHYFRVRAVNAAGVSANSNVRSATTLGPHAPTATGPSNIMATSFRANWNNVSAATSYKLDVSADNFSTFTYNDVTVNGTWHTVVNLSPNTTYSYRVRSVNAEGTSESSNVISVTTASRPPAPILGQPSNIESTQFTASWSIVSGATYWLQVSATSNFSNLVFNEQGITGTSRTVTGLNPDVLYHYRVFAVTSAGTSESSNVVMVQTRPPAPLITEQVESYTTSTSFSLPYYTQVPGAIEIRADVSLSSTFATFLPGYQDVLITDPYFIHVSGLTGGTPYYVRARAAYPAGTSSNSNAFMAVTKPAILPATDITMTSFVASCNSVIPGPLDYYLDVSTSSDFSSFVPGYQGRQSSGPSVLVTGLSTNTTYYYRFRVDYGPVMSYSSDYGTVTTLPPMPEPPVVQETGAYKGPDFLWVVWAPSPYATSYYLDIAYDSEFDNMVNGYSDLSVSGEEMGPYKRFEATGLQPGTRYYFRVQAVNAAGVSGESNIENAITNWPDVMQQNKNMIVSRTALKSITQLYDFTTLAQPDDIQLDVTYFDDLGRPEQQISWHASPAGMDIVQPIRYDNYGRQEYQYLPYASDDNEGMYRSAAVSEQQTYYSTQYNDAFGVSKSIFDDSPLNRVIEQGAPGSTWQPDGTNSYESGDHTIKSWWETNAEYEVRRWTYTEPSAAYPLGLVNAISSDGVSLDYYPPGSLYKTKTKDENGHEVIQYTDKNGQTILKRVQVQSGVQTVDDTHYASTYYIYDDFGNLVTVIQPEGVQNLLGEFLGLSESVRNEYLKKWAFRYVYDGRKRMVIKQVPGADPIYMVYDKRNRLVLTQDGNQRNKPVKEWSFTKYDAIDRTVLTGIYADPANPDRETIQEAVDVYYNNLTSNQRWFETYVGGSAPLHVLGYDNKSFPQIQEADCHSVTYYDKYDTYIAPAGYEYVHESLVDPETSQAQETASSINTLFVRGLVTGIQTKNLGNGAWLRTVNYYDKKYRLVQTIGDHQKGKVSISNILDFTGKVVFTKRSYLVNGVSHYILENPHHDRTGRLLWIKHSIDGAPYVTIAENEYDESGQLVSKKLHKTQSAPEVAADPLVGQPGVTYADEIVTGQYNNEVAFIGKTRVRFTPGFTVPAGSTLRARIGLSQQDADVINAASTTFAQEINYTYNIRGWLTKINEPDVSSVVGNDAVQDYFGMELAYQNALAGTTADEMHNGNISAMQWSAGAGGLAKQQAYGFSYDAMNRMLTAGHSTFKWGSWTTENDAFSESIGEYDHNGNIKQLTRKTYNGASLDILSYDYTGNRLNYVNDTGDPLAGFINANTGTDDYSYDHNGNLSKDRNKGIQNDGNIKYNHLNLPVEIVKGGEKIKYIYSATGTKLAQEVYDANGTLVKVTDYIGELIYENNTLKMIQHPDGRILPDGAGWEHQYYLKDHLGNIRVTFTTKPQTAATVSTDFETASTDFENFSSTTFDLVDHTDAGSVYDKVQWLNGGEYGRVGVARSFPVMPGDQVSLTAFAKYMNLSQNGNPNEFITSLAAAFGVSPQSTGEDLKIYNGLNSFAATVPDGDHEDDDESAPKVFVTVLFFDGDYNLVDAAWDQVTTTHGAQTDDEVKQPPHDELSITATAPEGGYAYVFVSNEHPFYVDVYVDDVTVTHTPSPIVDISDYYPFGLTFNNYSRENGVPQDYKYNGKELQGELGLGWLDYGARMYMPEIGRWGVIDPLGALNPGWTPYRYALNNPLKFIDPQGLIEQTIYDFEGNAWTLNCKNGECDDEKKKKDENNKEENQGKESKNTVSIKPYEGLPRVEVKFSMWAGLRWEYDAGTLGFKLSIISTNIGSGKLVLYVKNGKLHVRSEAEDFLPFDLGINGSINLQSGVKLDAAEYGRYAVEGSTNIQASRDQDGYLQEVILKDPEIQSAIGYMFVQAKAQGNFQTEKGMVSIQIGQDFGAGTGLGWSASAWLIIPIIEE